MATLYITGRTPITGRRTDKDREGFREVTGNGDTLYQ